MIKLNDGRIFAKLLAQLLFHYDIFSLLVLLSIILRDIIFNLTTPPLQSGVIENSDN